MTIKGFATFFTSRGKKEKDASSLSASANNNNNAKVPAIKVNDAFLAPPQRDARAPSPSPTTTGSSLSSAFARLHRPSLASLRKHVSSDAHSTHHHHPSPSSSSSHSHLLPHHHQHHPSTSSTTSASTSRLALSRSFFRSVSDVSKSFATSNSTPSSSVVSTPATETCTLPPSSATSSTSTVHLTAGRKPSNASLINDMIMLDPLALNENGKARHEALPRAPTPSQLDPHPQPSSTRLVVPQTSLAPTSTLLAPAVSSHPEPSSRGANDGIPSHHPTANITSNNFDGYDPFAAHYTPPASSTTSTSTRKRLSPPSVPALTTSGFASVGGTAPESLSPLQLAPKVGLSSSSPGGTVGKQLQPKSAGRPRALSLGSSHHAQPPPCPAHVLGPLPPLPPFAQGLVTKGTVLAAAGAVIQRIDNCRNEEAPNSAPAHAVTFSGRDRSGSVASGGTSKSAGCNVTRRPSTGGGLPLSSSSSSSPSLRPRTSPRSSSSEKHWSGELLSRHHHHHHGPVPLGKSLSEDMTAALGWPDVSSPLRPGKRVPQLDQTWAQFLSETQSEFGGMIASPSTSSSNTSGGASTITARTSSTARVAGGNNASGLVGQPPRGPPPNRPLPPAPVPIQPLNIRRRARAQTVGTTSPMVSPAPTPEASSVTTTVSQPVVGSNAGGISPPISPPPTAGSKLDFGVSSILDVVVTPAAESVDFDDIAKMMETGGSPATVSSLPYLRRSDSVGMSSTGLHAGGHSRNSSLSGSEWDGSSRTVSEMSLSLFPAPPARPTPTTEPAVASASSLMPPPSSLSSVLELPTPPVTPTGHRFVPATPGLYSASVASRSTSTIRPSNPEEAAPGDRDSCVLPLEDQVHLHRNTPVTRPPSEVAEPPVRYSADSSRSEPDFISSATTVSSHEMDTSVEESLCRTSLDTDQTSERMMHIVDSPPRSSRNSLRRKAAAAAGSSANARMLWCPPSPPQADRHSTQGKDKFNLLPNFYFDATFAGGAPVTNNLPGQPPSTQIKNRKSGVARREQLLNLLSANESAAQRSPGSPWAGRVEWGEAL
ncbi:hypothetical protein FS837_001654 [Tulasnella sp. UAMH 9824]|nr:hypothetical protein FS837_001654 [Tulasnella sp. UAMH 9824]